jgi:hypothetical protein
MKHDITTETHETARQALSRLSRDVTARPVASERGTVATLASLGTWRHVAQDDAPISAFKTAIRPRGVKVRVFETPNGRVIDAPGKRPIQPVGEPWHAPRTAHAAASLWRLAKKGRLVIDPNSPSGYSTPSAPVAEKHGGKVAVSEKVDETKILRSERRIDFSVPESPARYWRQDTLQWSMPME